MLLLDEPTRGIDVGEQGRSTSHRRARRAGKAVLMVSSYVPELLGVCDRDRGDAPRPARPARAGVGVDAGVDARGGDRRAERETRAPGGAASRLVRPGLRARGRLVLFFVSLTGAPERYLSADNLRVVLAQTVIVALGAIGMTLMISAAASTSPSARVALTGVIAALALRGGARPVAAAALGVAAGGAVGLVNGARDHAAAHRAVHRHAGNARRRARRGEVVRREQTVNPPATWVNELAVTFPSPAWLLVRARRVDHARCSPSRWPSSSGAPSSAGASSRSAPTRRRRAPAGSTSTREGRGLRRGRAALRPRGRDADVAAAPGRSRRWPSASSST